MDFQMPTQNEIDAAIANARAERARVMREGLKMLGSSVARVVRSTLHRPAVRQH